MKKYDYSIISLSNNLILDNEMLQALGRQGWKLVSVVIVDGYPQAYFIADRLEF